MVTKLWQSYLGTGSEVSRYLFECFSNPGKSADTAAEKAGAAASKETTPETLTYSTAFPKAPIQTKPDVKTT